MQPHPTSLGTGAKFALVLGVGLFCGSSLWLWSAFGGAVYVNYLAGAFMRCF